MSYMRTPYYVYSSDSHMHLNDMTMEMEWFDALVVMRYLEMTDTERDAAEKLAGTQRGNFGYDAVAKKKGEETAEEYLIRKTKDLNSRDTKKNTTSEED